MEENEERTLYENLEYLNETKGIIKQAIIDKGVEISADTPFREYADKISDITTGEDLEAELSAQEQIIQEMKIALENKTAGGKVKLNIYAQTTEPTNKDGIWLETNKTFDKIYFKENIVQAENYDRTKTYPNIDITNYNGVVYIKPYIYYLGSNTNPYQIRRYNVETNIIEKLTDASREIFSRCSCYCAIGDIIYVFGSISGSTPNTISYKYDTKTGTITSIANCPHKMSNNCSYAIAYNNNIYLIGDPTSYSSDNGKIMYKYSPDTNSYTVVGKFPYEVGTGYTIGNICVAGNECYLFNLSNTSHYSYKMNLDTGVCTQLSNPPINFEFGIGVNQDNYIYIFNKNQSYRYDIINDTFTKLQNSTISSSATRTYAFLYENKMYITGYNNIDCMVLQYKDFENNSIVVSQGNNKYFTELISNEDIDGKILFPFNNIYFNTIENGLDDTIPTYYGDGTQWVKFKN